MLSTRFGLLFPNSQSVSSSGLLAGEQASWQPNRHTDERSKQASQPASPAGLAGSLSSSLIRLVPLGCKFYERPSLCWMARCLTDAAAAADAGRDVPAECLASSLLASRRTLPPVSKLEPLRLVLLFF